MFNSLKVIIWTNAGLKLFGTFSEIWIKIQQFSLKEIRLKSANVLTHLHLEPHMCVNESGQYWLR